MDREDDVIELGAASIETQGLPAGDGDEIQGFKVAGLSNE